MTGGSQLHDRQRSPAEKRKRRFPLCHEYGYHVGGELHAVGAQGEGVLLSMLRARKRLPRRGDWGFSWFCFGGGIDCKSPGWLNCQHTARLGHQVDHVMPLIFMLLPWNWGHRTNPGWRGGGAPGPPPPSHCSWRDRMVQLCWTPNGP